MEREQDQSQQIKITGHTIEFSPPLGKQILTAINSGQNFSLELNPPTNSIILIIQETANFEQSPKTGIEEMTNLDLSP